MSSSDDEVMSEDLAVIDFLIAKHDKYEWKDLEISLEEKQVHVDIVLQDDAKIFDLWERKFDLINKLHLNKHLHFHYIFSSPCQPFIIKIDNIAVTIIKGHHLKIQTYL